LIPKKTLKIALAITHILVTGALSICPQTPTHTKNHKIYKQINININEKEKEKEKEKKMKKKGVNGFYALKPDGPPFIFLSQGGGDQATTTTTTTTTSFLLISKFSLGSKLQNFFEFEEEKEAGGRWKIES